MINGGAITLEMWYLVVNEFIGSRNFISVFYTYESLMGGNSNIKEDRGRYIIYLTGCEGIQRGQRSYPTLLSRFETTQMEAKQEVGDLIEKESGSGESFVGASEG